jgi:hypothetical protein
MGVPEILLRSKRFSDSSNYMHTHEWNTTQNAPFTMANAAETSSSAPRLRVLLGVTGSVAAVKAPEIAVRLVKDCKADVKVLLSAGGQNFWNKAQQYDPVSWKRLQEELNQVNDDGSCSIEIHGKLSDLWMC